MKLYGIDLLLSLACVRVIKVQGLEFEAAENNLSEVPSHDKIRSAYDFWVRYLDFYMHLFSNVDGYSNINVLFCRMILLLIHPELHHTPTKHHSNQLLRKDNWMMDPMIYIGGCNSNSVELGELRLNVSVLYTMPSLRTKLKNRLTYVIFLARTVEDGALDT